jgi:hypothetical protein
MIAAIKTIWSLVNASASYLFALAKFTIAFPFLRLDWMLIIIVPTWLLWYMLATQPKSVDKGVNEVCNWLEKGANFLKAHLWVWNPARMVRFAISVILGITFFPLLACTYLFSKPFGLNLGRFVLTLGFVNFMTSKYVAGKNLGEWMKIPETDWSWYHQTPVGWIGINILGLALLLVWWNLRDAKYKAHFTEVVKTKGWLKGIPLLLIEDFLPKRTHWKCKACGYKGNPINSETGDGSPSCVKCGAPNPNPRAWTCECKAHNKADFECCSACGKPRPGLEKPAIAPAKKSAALVAPKKVLALPAHQGQAPLAAKAECPRCQAENPTGFKVCGACGFKPQTGSVTVTATLPAQYSWEESLEKSRGLF